MKGFSTGSTRIRVFSFLLFVGGAVGLSGCAGRIAEPSTREESREATLPPGVDRTRALTALADIEPRVDRPVRPADLNPLSERAAQQIAAARTLMDQQRYTEAAIELERALRYDPNHPDIHRTLALLQWQAGNAERAKSHAQRAVQGNPDDAGGHYVLGRCATAAGDWGTAIQEYRTSLLCSDVNQDPDLAAMAHHALAEVLAKEGYLQAALVQYKEFEEAAHALGGKVRDAELSTLLKSNRGSTGEARSRLLEKMGRFSEAADALGSVTPDDAADAARTLRHARLLHQADRSSEALAVLRTGPSDSDEAFDLLMEIHESAGHPEEAAKDLQARLATRPGDTRLAVKLSEVLVRLQRGDEARAVLRECLTRQPDSQAVRSRLLDLLADESSWTDFLEVCVQGIRVQPSRTEEYEARMRGLARNGGAVAALVDAPQKGDRSAVALYLCGLLASAANRGPQAEALLKDAVAADRNLIPARAALAQWYLQQYRYDEALTAAARREESTPEHGRLEFVLGQVYERLDQTEKAAVHFKAASQLNPADFQAMLELARLQRRSDDPLTAQRQLRVLLERQPAHEEAREALAMMYMQEGKVDAATEQLEEYQRRAVTPNAKARAQALLALIRNRDADAYRKALRAAMDANGPDAATWLALAESYNEFEQTTAREAYLSALAMEPDNENAALGAIFAEQRLLNYEKAVEGMAKLLPRRPNRHAWRLGWGSSSWQIGLVEMYLVLHEFEAALDVARREESRADLEVQTRTRYRLAMLESMRMANRSEELVRQLQAWSDGDSDDHKRWRATLAEEYKRQKKIESAVPILEASYRANQDDPAVLADYVDVLASAGQHDRAVQFVLDWLADDPDNDDALAAVVAVLADQKRFGEANDLVRNKLLHTRERERFQDIQLALLDGEKQHAEAVSLLESLVGGVVAALRSLQEPPGRRGAQPLTSERIDRLPNEPFSVQQLQERLERLRLRLAGQLIEARDYREADRRIREWLEEARSPGARYALVFMLANCQREQGDEVQAGETLELAMALQPASVALNNDVAYGWIDRGIKLDDAERMIRFTVSREPRHMAYLDTFGWLLYKKGEFGEARKWLTRAANTDQKKDCVVLEHLGDTCWRLGESEEAIRRWEEAEEVLRARPPEDKLNADERRVRSTVRKKIDDARAGRQPAVAALRAPETEPPAEPRP